MKRMGDASAKIEVHPVVARETHVVKPLHGGFGDGALHIINGTPLGQTGKDDPRLVGQDAFDLSDQNTRYDFAPETEFYNPATGVTDVRPGFETITYVGERGVLVLDPNTGRVSDIMQPDAFARETNKTGGLLPLDKSTARHTLNEGNPLIMAMAKDALRATIRMLGAATPAPEGAQAAMGVLAQRRQALEEKLNEVS